MNHAVRAGGVQVLHGLPTSLCLWDTSNNTKCGVGNPSTPTGLQDVSTDTFWIAPCHVSRKFMRDWSSFNFLSKRLKVPLGSSLEARTPSFRLLGVRTWEVINYKRNDRNVPLNRKKMKNKTGPSNMLYLRYISQHVGQFLGQVSH